MARRRTKPSFEVIYSLALLLKLAPMAASSSSSSSSTTAVLSGSPVANWDPSWAAASAHGTTVVVSFDGEGEGARLWPSGDEPVGEGTAAPLVDPSSASPPFARGCVVLLRSPSPTLPDNSPSNANPPDPTQTRTTPTTIVESDKDGEGGNGAACFDAVPLRQWVDTRCLALDRATRRWAWLPPSTFVAMTGLASDVDYLLATLMADWDSRAVLYEGPDDDDYPLGSGTAPPHLVATRDLAELLSGAAQSAEGGRPFGVQCLVVGPPPPMPEGESESLAVRPPPASIFTLDPGGGHRHWGVATAIGKGADRVRRNLHEELLKAPRRGLPIGAREALRVGLCATMSALGDDDDNNNNSGGQAHYTALVLVHRGNYREPLLGIVDPIHVQAVRKELVAEKASKVHLDAEKRTAS